VKLATVVLRPGESQEQLLKRFRKEVQKARILSTARKRRYYTSNSERPSDASAGATLRRNGETAAKRSFLLFVEGEV
jgi:ribosomal protein S21